MNRRTGSLNVNFREIARELGLSAMTVYRVVNLHPGVRRETRERVTEALNRYGYFTSSRGKNFRVLFDFTEHPYLAHYGEELLKKVGRLGFRCFRSEHRVSRSRFLDLAAECDVAVFVSIPDDALIDEARSVNPDLYTITLSTKSNADVTLSPDNTRGGELGARYFFRRNCRHIAVHLSEKHPTRMERFKAFYAEMKLLAPDSRIDAIRERKHMETKTVLRNYFDSTDEMPEGIFFLAGQFADLYRHEFLEKDPARFGKLNVLTFDHPQDQEFARLDYAFDRIGFRSQELLDWAEYYITNRPMMKMRFPIHTLIDVQLAEGAQRGLGD